MKEIILKETLENILSMRFILAFFICNLLFGLSSYIFVTDFSESWALYETKKADYESEMEQWEVYSQVQPTILREPSPVQVFGDTSTHKGMAPVKITADVIPVYETDSLSNFSLLELNSLFNFPTVTSLFISLVAILFTFDSISGEKRRGSLQLILSCPITRTKIVLGKIIGAIIPLLIICTSSTILFLLVFSIYSPASIAAAGSVRIILILLFVWLYAALFASLGVFLSSLTYYPATSLVSSLFIWVSLTVILPVLLSQGLTQYGLREKAQETEKEIMSLGGNIMNDHFQSVWSVIQKDHCYAESLSVRQNGILQISWIGPRCNDELEAILPRVHQSFDEAALTRFNLENELFQSVEQRLKTATFWSNLNPANALTNILNVFSGSDLSAHASYLEQARRYRERIRNYIQSNGGYNTRLWYTNEPEAVMRHPFMQRLESTPQTEEYLGSPEGKAAQKQFKEEMAGLSRSELNLMEMPRFRFQREPIPTLLDKAIIPIFLLICYSAIFTLGAVIRFYYYDVR